MWDTQIEFWNRVEKTETCWNWTAGLTNGYGRFRRGPEDVVYSHRQSYIWEHGRIPTGLVIDHLCRNTKCVNPAHLEAVTTQENLRRGAGPGMALWAGKSPKTECIHGHEYSEANKGVNKDGSYFCRECSSTRARGYYSQRKARRAEAE